MGVEQRQGRGRWGRGGVGRSAPALPEAVLELHWVTPFIEMYVMQSVWRPALAQTPPAAGPEWERHVSDHLSRPGEKERPTVSCGRRARGLGGDLLGGPGWVSECPPALPVAHKLAHVACLLSKGSPGVPGWVGLGAEAGTPVSQGSTGWGGSQPQQDGVGRAGRGGWGSGAGVCSGPGPTWESWPLLPPRALAEQQRHFKAARGEEARVAPAETGDRLSLGPVLQGPWRPRTSPGSSTKCFVCMPAGHPVTCC